VQFFITFDHHRRHHVVVVVIIIITCAVSNLGPVSAVVVQSVTYTYRDS